MFTIIWPLRGAYGRIDERVRIRHEPDLADRAVGRVRREEVQARERLHALHEPDPARHPPRERPTWVLLPRMTPPLSQYRKRTSWRPRSFAS